MSSPGIISSYVKTKLSGCYYAERPCCHKYAVNQGYCTWRFLSSQREIQHKIILIWLTSGEWIFLCVLLRFIFFLNYIFISVPCSLFSCYLSSFILRRSWFVSLSFVLLWFWKPNGDLILHTRNLWFTWEPPTPPSLQKAKSRVWLRPRTQVFLCETVRVST